ncbi:MAG: T9SS type A sorting domain-containing protein, partial [Bacteroidota bacterium]
NGYHTSPGHPLQGAGDPITNYPHKWVLRDIMGDAIGTPGAIPDPVSAGTSYIQNFQATLDPRWDDNNCEVVVLVQRYDLDTEKRQVLNAAKLGLNAALIAARPEPLKPGPISLSPNPATDQATLKFPTAIARSIRIVDTRGRIHATATTSAEHFTLDLEAFPDGFYLVEVRSEEGRSVFKLLHH